MDNSMVFHGDKGELRLQVLDYENTRAKIADDANWLRAKLDVKAGPFSGTISCGLTAIELNRLYQEISAATEALKDVVNFQSMEGNLSIQLEFQRTGTATLRGVITPYPAEANALHYEFHTDPISLEAAVQGLKRLVDHFPIRHAPHSRL